MNRGEDTEPITAHFKAIGMSGSKTVHDVWAHKDLGQFTDSFKADVPAHGVVMVKVH